MAILRKGKAKVKPAVTLSGLGIPVLASPAVQIPFSLLDASARPFDVVGLGQNSVDLVAVVGAFPRSNTKHRIEKFGRLPGGQVASAMVCCARLGWRSRYVGRFGNDELGQFGLASLEREGVDISAAETVAARTRFAMVLVDGRTGDRTVLWDRDPALALRSGDVAEDVWTSARVLHVDCEDIPIATTAARAARASGALTVIDVEAVLPGVPALLRHIDVIIASEGLPERLTGHHDTGTALSAMAREYGPAVACVTLGASGSLAICQGREIRTPAFEVPVVDSTGAGDAFRGGFIGGYLQVGMEADVADVLTYATAVAAIKCRSLGARDGLPRVADVEQFLRR
jgi:sulfofructose kinase